MAITSSECAFFLVLQPTQFHELALTDQAAHVRTFHHLRAQTLQVAGASNGVFQHPEV